MRRKARPARKLGPKVGDWARNRRNPSVIKPHRPEVGCGPIWPNTAQEAGFGPLDGTRGLCLWSRRSRVRVPSLTFPAANRRIAASSVARVRSTRRSLRPCAAWFSLGRVSDRGRSPLESPRKYGRFRCAHHREPGTRAAHELPVFWRLRASERSLSRAVHGGDAPASDRFAIPPARQAGDCLGDDFGSVSWPAAGLSR